MFIAKLLFAILPLITYGSTLPPIPERLLGTPLTIQAEGRQEDFLPVQEFVDAKAALQNTICFSQINQQRANNGKGPVQTQSQVETAAYNHNSWMVRNNCFSHQCPGEPSLGDRLSATGYRWGGVGEIIAKGQGDCNAAINSWMNSEGHRNIMLGNYRHVGCSGLNPGPSWTCVFANPL